MLQIRLLHLLYRCFEYHTKLFVKSFLYIISMMRHRY